MFIYSALNQTKLETNCFYDMNEASLIIKKSTANVCHPEQWRFTLSLTFRIITNCVVAGLR